MKTEYYSHQQIRDILRNQHNVIFFPNRQFQVPDITDGTIGNVVGSSKIDVARGKITGLLDYLYGEAVGDKWGANHIERRKWRSELVKRYGEPFIDVYISHNKFRETVMADVRLKIMLLAQLARDQGNDEAVSKLEQINNTLGKALTGDQTGNMYDKVIELNEKLRVVNFFEDQVVDVLCIFSN